MPIYEYRCSSCGNEHEALQKLSEPLLVTCPHCHKDTLTKLLSAAGFHLKGSGWYVTDFRNGSKPAAKPAAKEESTSDASSAPAADAKPAADGKAAADGKSATDAKSGEKKSETPAPVAAAVKPTSTE
jgi:putative FmdB family regulatory protein